MFKKRKKKIFDELEKDELNINETNDTNEEFSDSAVEDYDLGTENFEFDNVTGDTIKFTAQSSEFDPSNDCDISFDAHHLENEEEESQLDVENIINETNNYENSYEADDFDDCENNCNTDNNNEMYENEDGTDYSEYDENELTKEIEDVVDSLMESEEKSTEKYTKEEKDFERKKTKRDKQKLLKVFIPVTAAVCACALAVGFGTSFLFHSEKDKDASLNQTASIKAEKEPVNLLSGLAKETKPVETEPIVTEPPITLVSSAKIDSMGDLLIHAPIIYSAYQKENETYDFSNMFRFVKKSLTGDYSVVNLETTFGGLDSGVPYQGAPQFNCPDSLANALASAGYDMVLTANNHCSDTYADGISRTIDVATAAGLDVLGTQKSANEKNYKVVDVNGIKIGMISYTYATGMKKDGQVALNKNAFVKEPGVINAFMDGYLPDFYKEAEQEIANMKNDGAEAIMFYMHWGNEYKTEYSSKQKEIAQKLCDLGVDVIIGGHPHVIQPVELLTSTTDDSHKTICAYSLGNALSNQRIGLATSFPSAGYTEDGVIFSVTFDKYSDGKVKISDVEAIPTWVNLEKIDRKAEYTILPATKSEASEWTAEYGIDNEIADRLMASNKRTMELIGTGVEQCDKFFQSKRVDTQ